MPRFNPPAAATADAAPLIEAVGLCREYGALRAVDDLHLRLERGEVLGLLGPNGAGKTSTMEMLCGTLAPTAGRIAIAGVDLLETPRRAKRALGYLPEQPPLYPDMTVRAFLKFAGAVHGLGRAQRRTACERALARCGLEAVARRPIGHLSQGYRQRVGIAQAILHEPPVVVLDEPTVGLDPIQIREIRALIAELGRSHGVILSTHVLPEVQTLCSRVAILHRGRIVHETTLAALDGDRAITGLVLGLRRPPEDAALAGLPGVRGVQRLGGDPCGGERLRLELDARATDPEAIAARAAAADWGLFELTPERRSLEQVFIETTTGDAPERPEAA